MEIFILIVHIVVALALIGLVMLQQGKGAEAGASFGSGASQTVFGSQGPGNFLTRTTAVLAAVFFATSIALAVMATKKVAFPVPDAIPSSQKQEPVSGRAGSAGNPDAPSVAGETGSSEIVLDSSDIPVVDSAQPSGEAKEDDSAREEKPS